MIKLILTPLTFYSPQFDEDMMFKWLKKIKCVKDFKGIGRELHVYVEPTDMSTRELLELKGLFERYNFDMEQLVVFMNEGNKHLKIFRNTTKRKSDEDL